MRRVTRRWALVIGVSTLSTAATFLLTAAEKPAGNEVMGERNAVGLEVSQAVSGERRTINMRWRNQPESALLIVNLDYHWGGQRRGAGSAHSLYGPVVVRSIERSGMATLDVDESRLGIAARPNSHGMLHVFVSRTFTVDAVESQKVEGSKDVLVTTKTKEFSAADCKPEFQLIGAQKGTDYASEFPDLTLAVVETTEKGFVQCVVPSQGLGASISTWLSVGDKQVPLEEERMQDE